MYKIFIVFIFRNKTKQYKMPRNIKCKINNN